MGGFVIGFTNYPHHLSSNPVSLEKFLQWDLRIGRHYAIVVKEIPTGKKTPGGAGTHILSNFVCGCTGRSDWAFVPDISLRVGLDVRRDEREAQHSCFASPRC